MWWLSLIVAVAPLPARFVMEVGGVPVGALEVRTEGGAFLYQSTQLFRRGAARATVRLQVDEQGRTKAGRVPEVRALLERPSVGCVDTVEERSGRSSRTCVQGADGGVWGTVDGARFTASYSAEGALERLEVDGARFVRSGAALPAPEDVFERGFPVSGDGPGFGLSPPLVGAHEVAVKAIGTRAQVEGDLSCLELARRVPEAQVVVGLVLEDGRAWPHAWVRKDGAALDPSALPGTRRRYLALPPAEAGRTFLELLQGTRRVVRP